jgi:hypothetical protein
VSLARWPGARGLGAALALSLAGPALAYVLPPAAVLKKVAEKRAALELSSVEASGTLELRGAALGRLGPLAPAGGASLSLPARILVKVAGKARLELLLAEAAEVERPYVSVKDDQLGGRGGLEATPAATALVRALAALLASPGGGEGKALGEALVRRGVKLDEAVLGRFNGRIALVLGGKAAEPKPLAFVDKESWMPLRLLSQEGGARLDVRLLDWASPNGGNWFPRAVEVWDGASLLLRFTTEKASANPRLPETLFQ